MIILLKHNLMVDLTRVRLIMFMVLIYLLDQLMTNKIN